MRGRCGTTLIHLKATSGPSLDTAPSTTMGACDDPGASIHLLRDGEPVRERSPRDGMAPGLVTDVYRYRSIGSLQALGLAAVASVVTTLLLLLVLGTPE